MNDKELFACECDNTLYGIPQNINTVPKFLKTYFQKYNLRRFLGTREFLRNGQRGQYEWYSYGQVFQYAILLAKGLQLYEFKHGDKLGIISSNRAEWVIADIACSIAGILLVPLYDNQSVSDVVVIAKNAELNACFCSYDCLDKVEAIKDRLKYVFIFDDKYDDRAQLQQYKAFNLQWSLELPQFTCFQMHSQYYFDELDKRQGIYSPSQNKSTVVDESDINKKVIRYKMHENGYYPYALDPDDAKILMHTQNQHQSKYFPLITHTFHQIIQRGYLALFDRNCNAFMVAKSDDIIETCFSLLNQSQPQDSYTIIATPGTENRLKFLILNQINILWSVVMQMYMGFPKQLNQSNQVGKSVESKQEFFISSISPAHISTRALQLITISLGGAIGFPTNIVEGLKEDVKALRPTFINVGRRDISSLKAQIEDMLSNFSAMKRQSYKKALIMRQKCLEQAFFEVEEKLLAAWKERKTSEQAQENPNSRVTQQSRSQSKKIQNSLQQPFQAPNHTFDTFQKLIGGRCKFLICQQSIEPQDIQFITMHFDISFQNAWQISEISGYGALRGFYESQHQYIQMFPDKNTKIYIKKLPELGWHENAMKSVTLAGKTVEVPLIRGQIVISGPSLATQLINNYQQVKKQVYEKHESTGLFYSGDVGEYDVLSGGIHVIGRISEAITMKDNQLVFASDIERVIEKLPSVNYVYLHTINQNNGNIIFIPILQVDNIQLKQVKQKHGESMPNQQNILDDAHFIEQTLLDAQKLLNQCVKTQNVTLKAILIDINDWTPQNGLLTPLLELKRNKMQDIFGQYCERLLEELKDTESQIPLIQKYSHFIQTIKIQQNDYQSQ